VIALFRWGHLAVFCLVRIFAAFVARERADHDVDAPSDEFWRKIGMAVSCDVGEEFVDDGKSDLGVRHFPSAKFQRDLDLHVLAEKINRVGELDAEIVRVNARA